MSLSFGTSGDMGYLRGLMDEQGLRAEVIAQDEFMRDGMRVEYLIFRVTDAGDQA